MALCILFVCFFIALIVVGAVGSQPWKSNRHMINVEWLNDSDKFELIARWGVIG